MRQIKFRGLTEGDTCVYGDLINYENGRKAIIGRQLSAPGYLSVEGARISPVQVETVGQFTGFQDSKGQDIYEGDIVYIAGFGNGVASICHANGAEFTDRNGDYRAARHAAAENDIGEVIGNIHTYPELLKGDNNEL